MTVFKTFLKVLNKAKAPIIMYTVFLIFFAGFNMQTSENSTNFVASKPDILIINQDKEEGITENKYCYKEEEGFYKNENYKEPEPTETEKIKELQDEVTNLQLALAEIVEGGM